MRFSSVFQILVATTFLFTATGYWMAEPGGLVTFESIIYLLMLSVILIGLSVQARSRAFPLIILLCVYVYLKYLLSGLYLLLSGYSAISADLSIFNHDHYNNYLLYAVMGFLAASLGLIVGGCPYKKPRRAHNGLILSDRIVGIIKPTRILVYVLLVLGTDIYLRFFLAVEYEESADDPRNFLKIFLRESVPRELLVLMLFLMREKYSRFEKNMVLMSFFVVIFGSMIVDSSRAGLYIIGILYLIIKLAKEGDFLIKFRYVKYFSYIAVLSVVLFPVVTAIRWAGYDKDFFSSRDTGMITEHLSFFTSIFDVFVLILERFADLRQALKIMNDMYVNDPTGLLSFSSMLMRIINNLVPGEIFNVMPPQYLYDHIFEDRFIGFNAQEWGLWEYFHIPYGYWLGLIVVFLYMVIIAFLWRKLSFSRSPFQPLILIISGYFFTAFLVNYDPAYVIASYLIELIVLFTVLPFLSTFAIYTRIGVRRYILTKGSVRRITGDQ